MKCKSCGVAGMVREVERRRKRDGAMCTYRICHNEGCGYSQLIKTVIPQSVKREREKQIRFSF